MPTPDGPVMLGVAAGTTSGRTLRLRGRGFTRADGTRGDLLATIAIDLPPDDAELRAFVERILADVRVPLPRAVVMDVGVIRGRGWAVVELNAAWGSGIYGCDPTEVLKVLQCASVGATCDHIG